MEFIGGSVSSPTTRTTWAVMNIPPTYPPAHIEGDNDIMETGSGIFLSSVLSITLLSRLLWVGFFWRKKIFFVGFASASASLASLVEVQVCER